MKFLNTLIRIADPSGAKQNPITNDLRFGRNSAGFIPSTVSNPSPRKKRNRLLIRAVRWKKSESFPESRSGLRSESEYDFVLRENFRRNSSDISNDRHREILWNTVNRRIGIRFRHVLRAGRRDVDGRLLTNVSRVFADVKGLPVSSPQLAADNRPVRPASPRRFRRGFREDLRSRSAPATCCTEYTANRLRASPLWR